MSFKVNYIQGIPIVVRSHEKVSDVFGCVECAKWRFVKYCQIFGVSKKINSNIDELKSRLKYFPDDFVVAISGIEGDSAVVLLPAIGCRQCSHKNASRSYNLKSLGIGNTFKPGNFKTSQDFRCTSAKEFIDSNSIFFGVLGIATTPIKQRNSVEGTSFYNAVQFLSQNEGFDVAGGKGDTEEQAKASCIGEAIERYFLSSIRGGEYFYGSYDMLKDFPAVNPHKEWGFPVNDSNSSIAKYDNSLEIVWTMSSQIVASKYDATMTESRSVLLPNDIVSMPPLSVERYSNICAGSTNGTASGATYSDAVIQSCLEIIERDAYWFYMRTDAKPVEIPDYAYPPYLKNLIEKILQ